MNVVELAFFLTAVAGGCVAADWLGGEYGWPAGVGGFVGGFFLSVAALAGPLYVSVRLSERRRPTKPTCRNGTCGPLAYKFDGADKPTSSEMPTAAYWRCECGDRYVQHGEGFDLFSIAVEADEPQPYMRRSGGKRWTPVAKVAAPDPTPS